MIDRYEGYNAPRIFIYHYWIFDIPKANRVNLDHYQAAREGAVCYCLQETRYLPVAGDDRLAFLQSQTTNDLRLLDPATAIVTILASPTARILDVLSVFYEQSDNLEVLDEQAIVILTTPGNPAVGHEISQEFTPLEAGLRGIVSDSKGCYTGQEVIARQLTYDKASHSLCGIRLKDNVAEGAKLSNQEKEIGRITSLTESPIFGLIGLAIIKRPFNQPGMNVQAGSVRGEIVSLPFIL